MFLDNPILYTCTNKKYNNKHGMTANLHILTVITDELRLDQLINVTIVLFGQKRLRLD